MQSIILNILRVSVLIGMTQSAVDFQCMGRDSAGKCTYCAYSYINDVGDCQEPVVPIRGCYSYRSNEECIECFWGELLDGDGQCAPLSPKNAESCFLSYISTTSCSHCKNSVLTMNGKCTTHKRCSDPNCDVCYMWGAKESCYVCKTGYVVLGKSMNESPCERQEYNTVGCYWSVSHSDCLMCDWGYYYVNKTCTPTQLTEMNRSYASLFKSAVFMLLLILF